LNSADRSVMGVFRRLSVQITLMLFNTGSPGG
jgi:hypothetical protein